MKTMKTVAAAIAACCLLGAGNALPAEGPAPDCKAAYLCDFASGTEVLSQNGTERLPIASMCKIMTLLLSFEAADRGELGYDELVTASARAAGMGGSQVFLGEGLSYTVSDLLKSVAVCSANDSCVALAERIAGSEGAFVERMNERAKELGANDTLFANCTGLPLETQYSCARDVSLMLRELLLHEKYFTYSRTWLEDFVHPDGRTIQMTNTNKLVRNYEGCDGGKTGFTNQAGFCLAATAKRGETRLVSVVIGAESSKGRFEAVKSLFDYGFSAYETRTILNTEEIGERAKVIGSKVKELPVAAERPLTVFCKRGEKGNYSVEFSVCPLRAPVEAGTEAGCAALYRDGVEIGRTRLLTLGGAEAYSYGDAYREIAKNKS